ncbi:nucleotidyltransferase domain-containing protein [Candidatus Woesearchaeota archaeon]|nr:nucleotidyltransferase domain-containing protein [Candidatus Woesearchaeota archaeon]
MNNKEKILKEFFEDTYKSFHIRLLARLTKLNPNTIITITDELAKEGLIKKEKQKDSPLIKIKANTEDKLFKLKKKFYNIEKLYSSGIIDFLNEKLDYPTIILFGSYAKAENKKESDIDLFILATSKKELQLKPFEEKLHAEIQLFYYTKQEFNTIKNKNKELINNIINGYRFEGFIEVL